LVSNFVSSLLIRGDGFSGGASSSFGTVAAATGSYSYPCISPQREQQFDLYDQVEEELGGDPI
jgi:hypothetical protein